MNDVLLTSDHPFRSVLKLRTGDGYAQYGGFPVIIQSEYHITGAEYQRLVRQSQLGRETLLDEYGATSPVEFFAVATESFFEQPVEMNRLASGKKLARLQQRFGIKRHGVTA